jgi:hypothetical protein
MERRLPRAMGHGGGGFPQVLETGINHDWSNQLEAASIRG